MTLLCALKLHCILPRWQRRFGEKGNAMVLFLIILPAAIAAAGLALDWGRGVWFKTQLQKAADAGALAGAGLLPNTAHAEARATEMVGANFHAPDIASYIPYSNEYEVILTENLPTTFMHLFGRDIMEITVHARAHVRRPVGGLRQGGFPIAIINPNLNTDSGDDLVADNYGRVYIIGYGEDNVMVEDWANGTMEPPSSPGHGQQGGCGNSQGWRGVLGMRSDGTLGNSGASDLRYVMEYGFPGQLLIDDLVPIKTGNMAGPMRDGREARLGDNPVPWGEFDNYIDADTGRVILVPVVHLVHETRRDQYTVQDWWNSADWDHSDVVVDGFAPFFLLGEGEYEQYLDVQGNAHDWVLGYYIPGTDTRHFLPPDGYVEDMGLLTPPRLVD
jgi:hypothetical protein